MKNNDRISIIIPVYNSENTLDRCLTTVISQDYTNIEILIVDDGSTDKSSEIIKAYQQKNPRIKAFFQQNAGPNAARKKGVDAATGDWIVFVDSDDSIDKSLCSTLLTKAVETRSDIVGCSMRVIDMFSGNEEIRCADDETYTGHEASLSVISTDDFWVYNRISSFLGYIFPANTIKRIFSKIDLNIILSEDTINTLLIDWDADKVTYIPDPLYTAYFHRTSLTHSHDRDFFKSEKHLYNYGMIEMRKRNMPDASFKQLEYLIMQNMMVACYSDAFGHLDWLYPFNGVHTGSRVVVYGAGEFGYELVRYIIQSEKYTLVGCLDKKAPLIKEQDFVCKVSLPEKIKEMSYDYVVVAVTKPKVRKSIIDNLHALQVPNDKIRDIDVSKINYKYLPGFFNSLR